MGEILRELVGIPSFSKLSNRPVIEAIQRYLQPLGWHTRVLAYTDHNGAEKLNLLASPMAFAESQIETELAIICHTDTVPFGEWKDAIELCEHDGNLHGCGACDVKGFLACMLAAAVELEPASLSKRLCMVFTSDEEIGCKGARFLYEQQALRARYAIVGEPTSLVPSRAGKGYCLAEVKVRGKAAHSAYPAAGRSAIFAAAQLLGEIEALAQMLLEDRDEAFSPPYTTLNVGEIRGGTAKNVVPEECSFLVEWRPIPSQAPERVFALLQQGVDRISTKGCEIKLTFLRMDRGFDTVAGSAVIEAVKTKPDVPAQTISFGTEAPWLVRMGAETVVIGPGSMLTAHSSRECVPVKELDDCVRLLHRAIELLCK